MEEKLMQYFWKIISFISEIWDLFKWWDKDENQDEYEYDEDDWSNEDKDCEDPSEETKGGFK